MHYTPSTLPERSSTLLARATYLYRIAFKKVILLGLMLAIVSFLPRLIVVAYHHNVFKNTSPFGWLQVGMVLIEIGGLVLFAAILWQLHCVMIQKKETIRHDMIISLHKIPLIIVASIIQTLILLIVTFTIVGIYLFLHSQHLLNVNINTNPWHLFLISLPLLFQFGFNVFIFILLIFYLPLIVIENKGIISSLGKSARLVWGYWWRTLGLQLTPWVIYAIVLITVKYSFHLPINIYFIPIVNFNWTAVIIHMFMFALFIPWYAAILLVQLSDLELRKKLFLKA